MIKQNLTYILLHAETSGYKGYLPGIVSRGVFSVGNKNRTPTALGSLPAFVILPLSLSPDGLPERAIRSTDCSGLLNVCGVAWLRRLCSCCSNDSNDDEPDVDLPGVVMIDFSGDRLLTSVEVTPLTSVKSGSSVIPVSLSESLCNVQMTNYCRLLARVKSITFYAYLFLFLKALFPTSFSRYSQNFPTRCGCSTSPNRKHAMHNVGRLSGWEWHLICQLSILIMIFTEKHTLKS